jgi:hypothetical protein
LINEMIIYRVSLRMLVMMSFYFQVIRSPLISG